MRPLRVRITVRRAMIAIAALAVVLWASQTGWRWQTYRKRAAYHALAMANSIAGAQTGERWLARLRREIPEEIRRARQSQQVGGRGFRYWVNGVEKTIDDFVADREEHLTMSERALINTWTSALYHERLYRKYRAAAARPWLRAAPDPPSGGFWPVIGYDPRPEKVTPLSERAVGVDW